MKKWLLIIIGMAMVFGGSTIFLKDTFGDSIEQVAEAVAVNAVATKINNSITTTLDDESLGEPLIYTERDEEGNIQYLEPNSRLINKLIMSFSTKVKENYSLTDIEEIKVNLGVITGSRILSQLPFYVTVKVQPVSLTKFQCETAFETQGINQTRYTVYCTVTKNGS
jgi:sporulation protein YunB